MKTLKLKNDIKELYHINSTIHNEVKIEDFQLDLIIEEIFSNIINYSNADYIMINYNFDNENNTIYLEFIDNGIPHNPLLKEDPEKVDNIEEARIGGLGIYLTKNIADKIEYHNINNENHLKIIKKVK